MAESHLDIFGAPRQLASLTDATLPGPIIDAGENATRRFLEFFTVTIRNRNTRSAYARAAWRFFGWCQERGVSLDRIEPMLVSLYIEELGGRLSAPSVKQHLAAIRMLFDWLVTGHVVANNPASSVRGPRHSTKKGKTPVLLADEAAHLLLSIPAGLRDRAMIGIMVYSFARVSAAIGMNVEDYAERGRRMWFRLHEKGGKFHEVPAHHKAEELIDAYVSAAGIHAAYLGNGGTLENAQRIAAHESPRTTSLYDRTSDEVSLDEIERILI